MAPSELTRDVEGFAAQIGAVVWRGIPVGGPSVSWPDDDHRSFFGQISPLRPPVVYFDVDHDVVAVSIAGVLHLFDPMGITDQRPSGPYIDLMADEYLDDEDDEIKLTAEQMDLATRIAEDDRFEPLRGFLTEQVLEESGIDFDSRVAMRIEQVARTIFEDGIGAQLEKKSRAIVRELIKHPDYDPLFVNYRFGADSAFIDEAIDGQDPRLRSLVEEGLSHMSWNSGLADKAERQVKADARRLISEIPRLVLDQVGFVSRNASRDSILEPYLQSVSERRRSLTAQWIKNMDGEKNQVAREVRYAVAAQKLVIDGATKKSVAAKLSLSTSVLDRLLTLRVPETFEFSPDDPIVVELAPELRPRGQE